VILVVLLLLLARRDNCIVNSFFFYLLVAIICLLWGCDAVVVDVDADGLSCTSTLTTSVDAQHNCRYLLTSIRLLVLVLSLVLNYLVVPLLHWLLLLMLSFHIVLYLLSLWNIFLG
jgi:hypothetical protein